MEDVLGRHNERESAAVNLQYGGRRGREAEVRVCVFLL